MGAVGSRKIKRELVFQNNLFPAPPTSCAHSSGGERAKVGSSGAALGFHHASFPTHRCAGSGAAAGVPRRARHQQRGSPGRCVAGKPFS